ncbi:DUF4145 domain-containing protein [Paraclostridium sordellii]|uniref:DUF4145 domain-containing protein n=1 Tax=Paraclostridium sordellii TaxID=1505 RepID=UPI0005E15F69|nr:DUF4145 domain-containing protein [Paeniclostridium sordellii]CEP44295.1 Uncharacterised protein [[Clostridium] sordellii] [Paeniclostridium sordellii]
MASSIYNHNRNIKDYGLREEVSICPCCNKGIKANYLGHIGEEEHLAIIYTCPVCKEMIIVKYRYYFGSFTRSVGWNLESIYPYNEGKAEFDDSIKSLSENFCNIYNQAKIAENLGLNEICGIGYRKALEFLIKDYAKSEHPDEGEEIEKKLLKKCIDKYIEHPEIKACATGATYLGNDETHYIRKWIDKDIKDLKLLIQLTLSWINMKEMTKKYKDEMGL